MSRLRKGGTPTVSDSSSQFLHRCSAANDIPYMGKWGKFKERYEHTSYNVRYLRVGSKSFWPDNTKAAPNGKCCEGYIVPSMVRLMYQLKSVLK
jgi:hypothetical protein